MRKSAENKTKQIEKYTILFRNHRTIQIYYWVKIRWQLEKKKKIHPESRV